MLLNKSFQTPFKDRVQKRNIRNIQPQSCSCSLQILFVYFHKIENSRRIFLKTMNLPKLKLEVTTADPSSTCVNQKGGSWSTNTFFERLPSKKRRNSLVVEETGRLTSRRSSVPNDAFISINDPFRQFNLTCVLTFFNFSTFQKRRHRMLAISSKYK